MSKEDLFLNINGISLSKIFRMIKKNKPLSLFFSHFHEDPDIRSLLTPYLSSKCVPNSFTKNKWEPKAYFYRYLSFTLKFLISKRVNFHEHKCRYLPVFCLVTICLCVFAISHILLCKNCFLIHLKSKFKSNPCSLQSKQCLLLHASSHEKLIFGHIKKWLNTEFPKTKQGAQRGLKPLTNPITKVFSLYCVSQGMLQSR